MCIFDLSPLTTSFLLLFLFTDLSLLLWVLSHHTPLRPTGLSVTHPYHRRKFVTRPTLQGKVKGSTSRGPRHRSKRSLLSTRVLTLSYQTFTLSRLYHTYRLQKDHKPTISFISLFHHRPTPEPQYLKNTQVLTRVDSRFWDVSPIHFIRIQRTGKYKRRKM